ncbi:UDP-glucose 4-epimerase [Alphaproteobacteria bacterium SO-S41]|nr:UDP-glucose 4-epimerase [Alphaproteobacteria bacterium SO-S41]
MLALPSNAKLGSYAGARCLVLGGGGFLGTALVRALADNGADVTAFARQAVRPPHLRADARWLSGDFADASALRTALHRQDVVFHLIGSTLPAESNLKPAQDIAASIPPTIQMLEICVEAGVKKVVFASSGGTVYGIPHQVPVAETAPTDPITAYGISKLAIEKYLSLYRRNHGLDYQVLRIANAYGPGQMPTRSHGVVSHILNNALDGIAPQIWGDGSVVRDFVYVDDVVAAFLCGAAYGGEHRLMNVGSGAGRTILSVASDLTALVGGPPPALHPGKARTADVQVNVLDIVLIERETGWRPQIDWQDGIRETARWLRQLRK